MRWADQAEQFVQALASSEPTPGGGVAAATAGAMGCALAIMAIRTTLKRKNTPPQARNLLEQMLPDFEKAADLLHSLSVQDAAAYENYLKAYRLPQTDFAREALVQESLWQAAQVPADTAQACLQVLEATHTVQDKIAPVILSDLFCARHLLRGAIACCVENIRTNLQYIKNPEQIAKLKKLLEAYESNGK